MINVFINEEYGYRYYMMSFNGTIDELKAQFNKIVKSKDFGCMTTVERLCINDSTIKLIDDEAEDFDYLNIRGSGCDVYIHWHEQDDSFIETGD